MAAALPPCVPAQRLMEMMNGLLALPCCRPICHLNNLDCEEDNVIVFLDEVRPAQWGKQGKCAAAAASATDQRHPPLDSLFPAHPLYPLVLRQMPRPQDPLERIMAARCSAHLSFAACSCPALPRLRATRTRAPPRPTFPHGRMHRPAAATTRAARTTRRPSSKPAQGLGREKMRARENRQRCGATLPGLGWQACAVQAKVARWSSVRPCAPFAGGG